MNDMVSVEVEGLKELRAALRQAEGRSPKELAAAGLPAATIAASAASRRVPSITGRTAGSVRPFATATGGGVRAGGAKAAWFGWLDFGGRRPQEKASGGLGRPVIKAGRYIYPAIDAEEVRIVDTYVAAIEKLLRQVGLNG